MKENLKTEVPLAVNKSQINVLCVCVTQQVYQFIRQLCKTSALVGPGSVFARKDNNFIAGTSTPTMLFSATPHPHTNITSVSRTEKDRKDDTHVDDDNEMTSLTTAVKSVEDVVHSSAYSSECLLPAVSTAQTLVFL